MEGTPPAAREAFAARRALHIEAKKERKRREKAFDAWLAAKPRRGAPGMALAAPGVPKPRILAEGDSWFDYPPAASFAGGIIPHLESIAHLQILSLAHYGDEVRSMLALDQRKRLEAKLGDDRYHFQALLMSGGGNDIVGDQFCLWLRQFQPGMPWTDAIDPARLARVMGIVEMGYRELIALRDHLRPDCRIFTHAYDFPKATGVPVCGVGPWLKPSLDYRGWTDPDDQFNIVKQMMLGFDGLLSGLENEQRAAGRPFTYIRTQGTLDPDKDWANEIHPSGTGFGKLAVVFNNALADAFPGAFIKR